MVWANTFMGEKSAVILYSQCDANDRSQQRHPILKTEPIQSKRKTKPKSNPKPTLIQILKKTESKSNPIQKPQASESMKP